LLAWGIRRIHRFLRPRVKFVLLTFLSLSLSLCWHILQFDVPRDSTVMRIEQELEEEELREFESLERRVLEEGSEVDSLDEDGGGWEEEELERRGGVDAGQNREEVEEDEYSWRESRNIGARGDADAYGGRGRTDMYKEEEEEERSIDNVHVDAEEEDEENDGGIDDGGIQHVEGVARHAGDDTESNLRGSEDWDAPLEYTHNMSLSSGRGAAGGVGTSHGSAGTVPSPPRSALVSRLFANQAKQEEERKRRQAAEAERKRQEAERPKAGEEEDVVEARVAELEEEIKEFKRQNRLLQELRKEAEAERSVLGEERGKIDEHWKEAEGRFEKYREAEEKKLKKERKDIDKQVNNTPARGAARTG
jgi:hypothetical protein